MTRSEISTLVEAANRIEPWDQGASPDGFTSEYQASGRRQSNDGAGDFTFNEGQPVSQPPAPKAAPVTSPAPAPEASPAATQAAPTSIPEALTPRQRVDRGFALLTHAPARDDAAQHPFLARALKSPKVKAALKAAQTERAAYNVVLKNTAPIIGNERRAADLLAAINNSADLAELEKLRGQYAECFGDAARAAAQSARRICRVAYTKLDTALHNLIDVAIEELDTIAPEIEADECALWAKYGLPHEISGLLKHLNAIKRRVLHHKATLELNAGPERVNTIIPGDGSQVFETFAA